MDGVIIIFHSLMIMPASLFFHRDEIKWCNDGFRLAAFQAKVIKYKFNIFVVRNCNWQDNWSIRHSNLCFMTIYTILWQFLTIFLSLLRHQVFKWLPLSVRWSVVQQRRFSSPNSWLFLKFTRYFKIFFPWHFCRVIWKIRPCTRAGGGSQTFFSAITSPHCQEFMVWRIFSIVTIFLSDLMLEFTLMGVF